MASEKQDQAASTIQKNFRGFKDRLKAREQAAFNINQLIEFTEEQDHLNLNRFFARWIKLIKDNEIQKYISLMEKDDSNLKESSIQIETNYEGIHLNETFSEDDLHTLIAEFKSNRVLHSKYVLMIVSKAIGVLRKLKNINEINCVEVAGAEVRLNVIGDLHGQFLDLCTIFEKFGMPSPHNIYLFNGDFVDRGPQQIETYLTLLYLLVLHNDKKCVYLNRGNHEDYGCSVRFGFKEEIMNKYITYSKRILKKCVESFNHLPLCTVINLQQASDEVHKILVVHGGISKDTDMDLIAQINRSKYENIDGTCDRGSHGDKEQKEREQLQDLVWSDPQMNNGCVFNKQRHIAKQFGPDITDAFLKKYGFALMVRSHECKNEGYELHHNNKCITIFSASNYCGGINKGAICVFRPKQRLQIRQFVAPGFESEKLNDRVEGFETKVIRNLRRLLFVHRSSLMENFKKADPKNTGYITFVEWTRILTKTLGIERVPWLKYKDKLVEYDMTKGSVKYESSFDNFDVVHTFSTDHKDINEALARYKDTLVALFNLIDDNNSGTINLQEFATACKIIFHDQNEIISDDAIKSMVTAMDANKDGKIDLSEFEQAFVIFA